MILAFRNAGRDLERQLDALSAQDFAGTWEVVAVDNGSTDSSRRIVQRRSSRLNLTIVDAPNKANLSYARNVGASAAAAPKLLFIDADDEVAPGYVRAMARALEMHGFVACRLDHETLNPAWVRRAYGSPWQVSGVDPLLGFLPFAGGGTIGVSRHTFDLVGGFDDDLAGAEDVAFAWDAQLCGVPLEFVPDAVLRLRYRDTLDGLYRQALAQGRALPLVYKRYRSVGLRRRPVPVVLRQWLSLAGQVPRVRNKRELAPLVVRFGFLVGRLEGSIRDRVLAL